MALSQVCKSESVSQPPTSLTRKRVAGKFIVHRGVSEAGESICDWLEASDAMGVRYDAGCCTGSHAGMPRPQSHSKTERQIGAVFYRKRSIETQTVVTYFWIQQLQQWQTPSSRARSAKPCVKQTFGAVGTKGYHKFVDSAVSCGTKDLRDVFSSPTPARSYCNLRHNDSNTSNDLRTQNPQVYIQHAWRRSIIVGNIVMGASTVIQSHEVGDGKYTYVSPPN